MLSPFPPFGLSQNFFLQLEKLSNSQGKKVKCVLKWVSCDNPEHAASCQAVQDKQLAQDKLQQSLSDVRRNRGLELEAGSRRRFLGTAERGEPAEGML